MILPPYLGPKRPVYRNHSILAELVVTTASTCAIKWLTVYAYRR